MIIGAGMGLCAPLGWAMGDPPSSLYALLVAGGLTMAVGLGMRIAVRRVVAELTRRDGFVVVALGWLSVSAFGALPYLLSGVIRTPAAALFESVSGFTTTGASVLSDLEHLPRGILFWRSLTHFFGGMGVLVLCVAVLPLLGTGGMQIFRAEVTGPLKNRLTPRIASTAKLLWSLYVGLISVEAVLLRLGGLSWFDAWCHSVATVATGGFSTRTDSLAAFPSPFVQIVVTFFMLISGVNFSLHYLWLRGAWGAHVRSSEFRVFLSTWALVCLAAVLWVSFAHGLAEGMGRTAREVVFQVTSLMTTTGFVITDYDRWPNGLRLTLMLLVAVGGCAGSTSGGMKMVRIVVALKVVFREIRRAVLPSSVMQIKVDGEPVADDLLAGIVAVVLMYITIAMVAGAAMTAFTPNIETAISSVITTLSGCGPGLGAVGPMLTYAGIPAAGQLILCACMLLGRLEFFTLLVLFLPRFWRR